MNLRTLTDDELISKTKVLADQERQITTALLNHLAEVYRRRLFAAEGFASLHQYMVEELKFSDGAAYRRIATMKLIAELPDAEGELKKGTVSLSTASQLQNFLQTEKREQRKTYTKDEKQALLSQIKEKSTRECERLLVSISPKSIRKDRLRSVTEDAVEICFVADRCFIQKLNKIKSLLSHKHPNPSYGEIFNLLADRVLNQIDPEKKPIRPFSPVKQRAKESRTIPESVRRAVWQRDKGQCQWRNPKTAKPCRSTRLLEIHHIQPYSKGGRTELSNLQLTCAIHNGFEAICEFGRDKMARYIPTLT